MRAAIIGARRELSAVRVVRVIAPRKGVKPVLASPRTEVLSPSTVTVVPASGQAGTVRYAGGNDVTVGQIIAIGQGPATPDGFLGRVTGVRDAGGQTVLSTVPATLEEAVPTGSLDLTASSTVGSDARRPHAAPRTATVECKGSVTASITQSMSFSTGISLKGSWSILHGLQSASLTADASAKASLKAVVAAAGSCALGSTPVLTFPGPSVDAFVGPVPVVMTSKVTVDLDAAMSAKAAVTASASANLSASAGIGWSKSRGFYPIETVGAHFGYNAPSLTANASVGADLIPKVDVLLYGVVGPEIALKAGLAFNADIGSNPWWTLTAPVDLTGKISIPPLKLSSPTLHIYQRTFAIANANAPFSTSGGGGGGGPGPGAGGGTGGTGGTGGSGTGQSISAGGFHSCALLTGGGIDCWGQNASGQLGTGTATGPDTCVASTPCSTSPVAVDGITQATGLSTGAYHTCAVLSTHAVDCWGSNASGQLGNGTVTDESVPVPVTGLSNATAVSAGADHTCAVLSTGGVDCWGNNVVAELGNGTITGPDTCGPGDPASGSADCSAAPVAVSGIADATEVAAGDDFTCALLGDESVDCWGSNLFGQLGRGTPITTSDACGGNYCGPTPEAVAGISTATSITAGGDYACALLRSGAVNCWGDNSAGSLGDGVTGGPDACGEGLGNLCSTTPIAVSGNPDATAISAGGSSACAVLASASVECWGNNGNGQLGIGTTMGPQQCGGGQCSLSPVKVTSINNAAAISAGEAHGCDLALTGSIECWGYNAYGALGDGTDADSYLPVAVQGFP